MFSNRCAIAVMNLAAGLAMGLVATSCAGRGPSPATQPSNPGNSRAAAAPAPPEEALVWHTISFPDATFTGRVLAAAAPTAFRAGDTLVIWVPFAPKAQARCTIVRHELASGGSIEALVAAPGAVGTRLRELSVDHVEVSAETGMLSLVAKRDNESRVEVAGYRDRRKALVCAADGARDLLAFKRMAESLVRSLQPTDAPPPPAVVELCAVTIGDGAPGFERTEIVEDGTRTLTRVTTFVAFRDGPAGLDLMEQSEDEGAVEGRVSELRTVRLFGGRADLEARLTRDAAGRYRAIVTGRRGQRYDGPVGVKGTEGLPSRGAIRRRIKSDLLAGGAAEPVGAAELVGAAKLVGAAELMIEGFDPLETPAEAVVRTYARGDKPDELTLTEGGRVSREVVDAEGFVRTAETRLSTGTRRSSTCRRENSGTGP